MSAPNDTKSRIMPLEAFLTVVSGSDSGTFQAQYPHPFLLLEAKEGDFGEAGFQTLATKEPSGVFRKPPPPDEEEFKTATAEDLETLATDLDLLKPRTPVAEKHEEIKKKLDKAHTATYVCPLVKRDVNKFASMITLGRAANNDIRINLPSISKFHAYFTHVQSSDGWFLADANSSNGTFVNGERLKGERNRMKLVNGAAIRLGSDVSLRFFEAKSFWEFLKTRGGGSSA